jgi:outer membrane cobalamin receptor
MSRYLAFILINFLVISLKAQTDSSYFFLKKDLLDVENLREWRDTGSFKVVSASRSAKNVNDLPVPIYVITHEEIIQNHYTSLADILKYLPGFRVSQPGSGETGEIFQFRGLIGNYYTKILINNIPIKPSVVAGMPLGAQLPIRQAERIEIIYGPAAAVYGADAVTGVINIITKEADKGTFVRGDIHLGGYDNSYINFTIGGKALKNKNILQYGFYGSKSEMNFISSQLLEDQIDKEVFNPLYYLESTGQKIDLNGILYSPLEITEEQLQINSITTDEFIKKYYPANYEGSLTEPVFGDIPLSSHMIGADLKWRGFTWSYNKMYRQMHSSLGRSTYLYKYNNSQNYIGESIQRTVLSYEKKWEKFYSSTQLSLLMYKMDNNSSYGVTFHPNTDKVYVYSASDDIFLEQLVIYNPFKSLEIVSGVSLQYSGNLPTTNYSTKPFSTTSYESFIEQDIKEDPLFGSFGLNPVTFYNISSFIQLFYFREKFNVLAGLRHDKNSLYGNRFNPRLALLYKLGERTTITASAGMAYLAPTSSMSYQSIAYPGGLNNDSINYIAVPNMNLEPEEFLSAELGIRRKFYRNIYVNLSFYYSEISNLITDTYDTLQTLNLPKAIIANDSSLVRTKKNISDALSTVYGIQANIKFNNIVESVKLNAELSFTYAETQKQLSEIGSNIGDFDLMPKHMGQLRLNFQPTERIFLQFDNVWMSKWLRILMPFEEVSEDLYESVDGYYTLDLLLNFKVSSNLRVFLKYNNVFDEKYGGLNATGTNEDLPYNPQMGSNIQVGLTYNLN